MPRRKSRGETQPGETMYSRKRGITTGPPVQWPVLAVFLCEMKAEAVKGVAKDE